MTADHKKIMKFLFPDAGYVLFTRRVFAPAFVLAVDSAFLLKLSPNRLSAFFTRNLHVFHQYKILQSYADISNQVNPLFVWNCSAKNKKIIP